MWRLVLLCSVKVTASDNATDTQLRNLAGPFGPRFPANTGPQWVDYPAYALSAPPKTPAFGASEEISKKGRKKGGIAAGPMPLFDILVEPEYIPDPIPAPYPFPIERGNQLQMMEEQPTDPPQKKKPRYRRHQYIERTDPIWTCPKDYIQEANNCVKIEQIEVDIGCPEGWRYESGVCKAMDIQSPDAVCDEGYIPRENKPECMKEVLAPKEMHCPVGFVGSPVGCKKNVKTAAVPECAPNSVFSLGFCRRATLTIPKIVCPPSFGPSPTGGGSILCYRESTLEGPISCGPGEDWVLVDRHTCERHLVIGPQLLCPSMYTLSSDTGLCVREWSQPALRACEGGELSETENACKLIEHGPPPQLVCQNTSQLNLRTGMCDVFMDIPAEQTCPKTHILEGGINGHPGRCLPKTGVTREKGKKGGTGLVSNTLPASTVCPAELNLNPQQTRCSGIISTHPEPVCVSPFSLGTGLIPTCLKAVLGPPKLLCPEDSTLDTDSEMCQILETTDPIHTCLPGFKYDTLDKMCHLMEHTVSLTTCPSTHNNSVEPGLCQRLEQVEASAECPASSVLYKDVAGRAECRGEEIHEPEYLCNVTNMTLEFTSEGPMCTGVQVEVPLFACPPTFREEGGRCIKYDVIPKRALCLEGYQLSFDVCLKEIDAPPLLLCPEGHQHHQESEMCVRKRHTDLVPRCPEDMQFDRLVGECYILRVDYDFDEDMGAPKSPDEEALKDLPQNVPPPTVPPPVPSESGIFAAASLPPPQLTIVQQPVVMPQPAVILPQQAPVPPPPAIRVPYGVPQPVPTPVGPKHQHIIEHHHHQTDLIQLNPYRESPPQNPILVTTNKGRKHI